MQLQILTNNFRIFTFDLDCILTYNMQNNRTYYYLINIYIFSF
jgi:hypothetical protein